MTNDALFKEAKKYIPGGVNSPVRSYNSVGGTPKFIENGKGAVITDAEGNEYIDYVGSFGPAILGHSHPKVIDYAMSQLKNGMSFGAPSKIETSLAKKIVELVPSAEKVRMTNSGTEAALSAVRLARGYTKRDLIVKFEGCYHGHVDALLAKAGSGSLTFGLASSKGIPNEVTASTIILPYNNVEKVIATFEKLGEQIAAVVVEPIAGNMSCILPKPGFLDALKKITEQYKSLLIFDEVMTGFRVSIGGAQSLYSIKPDITLLGKIIGGGLPVGAIAGRSEVLDYLAPTGPVYQAGTLSGNPIAMASGLAILETLERENIYPKLSKNTSLLVEGILETSREIGIPVTCNHVCGMFGIFFSEKSQITCLSDVEGSNIETFNKFFNLVLRQGINLAPSAFEAGFISAAHTEHHIEQTISAAKSAFIDIVSERV